MLLLLVILAISLLIWAGTHFYRGRGHAGLAAPTPTSAFTYLTDAKLATDPRYQLPTPRHRAWKKNP